MMGCCKYETRCFFYFMRLKRTHRNKGKYGTLSAYVKTIAYSVKNPILIFKKHGKTLFSKKFLIPSSGIRNKKHALYKRQIFI